MWDKQMHVNYILSKHVDDGVDNKKSQECGILTEFYGVQ